MVGFLRRAEAARTAGGRGLERYSAPNRACRGVRVDSAALLLPGGGGVSDGLGGPSAGAEP